MLSAVFVTVLNAGVWFYFGNQVIWTVWIFFLSVLGLLISDTEWPMSTSVECKKDHRNEEQANRVSLSNNNANPATWLLTEKKGNENKIKESM